MLAQEKYVTLSTCYIGRLQSLRHECPDLQALRVSLYTQPFTEASMKPAVQVRAILWAASGLAETSQRDLLPFLRPRRSDAMSLLGVACWKPWVLMHWVWWGLTRAISTSALPSFHLVADHEFGRLILLSSDTSGTDLEFTASRITKHRGINTGCGWISHPLASPHMEQLEPSQGAQQEGCSLHT